MLPLQNVSVVGYAVRVASMQLPLLLPSMAANMLGFAATRAHQGSGLNCTRPWCTPPPDAKTMVLVSLYGALPYTTPVALLSALRAPDAFAHGSPLTTSLLAFVANVAVAPIAAASGSAMLHRHQAEDAAVAGFYGSLVLYGVALGSAIVVAGVGLLALCCETDRPGAPSPARNWHVGEGLQSARACLRAACGGRFQRDEESEEGALPQREPAASSGTLAPIPARAMQMPVRGPAPVASEPHAEIPPPFRP